MNTTASPYLHDDPGIQLLGIQLNAKRAEQAALRSLGDALAGPGALVPPIHRTWTSAKAAEWNVHREIRRSCRRGVIPR
jgi:hypothetical protein